jgi:hypothetical protein
LHHQGAWICDQSLDASEGNVGYLAKVAHRHKGRWSRTMGPDNIIAAFEHNDRVCEIDHYLVSSSRIEKALAAMQQPFPELTHLRLQKLISMRRITQVIPASFSASFLGGSAPRMKYLFLDDIPFPGLPKLLLSATDLTDLHLRNITPSGYISSEEMATCLSVLTRLERFTLLFESLPRRPDRKRRRPPPPTRALLPDFTLFYFKWVGEYLDGLVAEIDAPLLNKVDISFFPRPTFETPQLAEFISRSPNLTTHDEAHLNFSDSNVDIKLPQSFDGALMLGISCRKLDQQVSSLAQVCRSSFPRALVSRVEHLYIDGYWRECWKDESDEIHSSQ